MILRLILISAATALLPSLAFANVNQEMNEGDFLDLVDASGHVTVQGNYTFKEQGIEAKNHPIDLASLAPLLLQPKG